MALIIDDTLIRNQEQNLKAAMSTDPKMRKVIQQHIREALFAARREVMASSPVENDPRKAIQAVRTSVYKEVLGGNINILTGKKQKAGAHGTNSYVPPRKLQPGQRGGNRVLRGNRTDQVMHYGPLDRWWIQYILEHGTGQRQAGTRNGRLSGNRGSIAPRSFFRRAAEPALMRAVDNLAALIDKELMAMIGNG